MSYHTDRACTAVLRSVKRLNILTVSSFARLPFLKNPPLDAISSIRTVSAFGGQQNETNLYDTRLETAMAAGVKKATMAGMMLGIMMFVMFSAYGTVPLSCPCPCDILSVTKAVIRILAIRMLE